MLKQNLQHKLLQKLSPQQIQLMKMIQLPTQAFEQKLKEEIEENPALESGKEEHPDDFEIQQDEYDDFGDSDVDMKDVNIDDYISDDEIPTYRMESNNYSSDDEDRQVPYASGKTFQQTLLDQLHTYNLSDEHETIAEFLIGSLDETGYLRRSIEDLVDDLAFTQNIYTEERVVEAILTHIIQNLDPIGVGARNLQECLLIQLKEKEPTPSVELAIDIMENGFDQFVKKHYKKLLQKFHTSEEDLRFAIKEIEKLNPKPGGSFENSNKFTQQIVPDFTVLLNNGELELSLNSRNVPELHVSATYNNMLKGYQESKTKSKSQKDAVLFIKQKLDSAKWFIDAIRQRQQTLMLTMGAIMDYQKDYFLSGDDLKIKPMILKDIADRIDMDVSTVSRVANSKYVATPYGTKLIKEFFSESMKNTDGEDVSTKEIKSILETVIGAEDKRKPLTDDKLAAVLKEKGYPIARRTVAKYREQLDLPVARLRKEI
ncbi:MAG: RNA polymerase factor sigma-54 [Flavobacteriaceae bacterium]